MSGKLIVLEGIDGSGKGTQADLLRRNLEDAGVRCVLLSFPRYQQTEFGRQIGRFLNGEFGALDQVDPLLASLLFAGDRWESHGLLLESLDEQEVVLCDRYVASNIAHQAAKRAGAERAELVQWIENLEFNLYQLPWPDLTLWLDLPVPAAQMLIARKSRRTYTEKAADLQEADGDYLEQVRTVYEELANDRPAWRRIDCLSQGQLRDRDEIAAEILETVRVVLQTT